MRNINTSIFTENGFEKYQDQNEDFKPYDIEFWIPSRVKQLLEAFFIVIYVDDLQTLDVENIKEACFKYYNIIERTEILKSAMEKNTYAIVCIKVDEIPIEQKIKKKIYEIEEDPQKFKKHVILYNENQINSFNNKIKDISLTMNILNDVLNSDEFQVFKKNPESDSLYSFVAELFIKLPFLKYHGQNKEIKDLSAAIADKIRILGEDKLVLLGNVFQMEIDEIKEIDTKSLIDLLKGVESNA